MKPIRSVNNKRRQKRNSIAEIRRDFPYWLHGNRYPNTRGGRQVYLTVIDVMAQQLADDIDDLLLANDNSIL